MVYKKTELTNASRIKINNNNGACACVAVLYVNSASVRLPTISDDYKLTGSCAALYHSVKAHLSLL